jgi:hypothetical protein
MALMQRTDFMTREVACPSLLERMIGIYPKPFWSTSQPHSMCVNTPFQCIFALLYFSINTKLLGECPVTLKAFI